MDEFMQDYRRKQGLPVHPSGKHGVSGTVEGHGAERLKATTTSGELKQRSTGSWPSQDEYIRMPLASEVTISASPADSIDSLLAKESDSEADRLFIESGNKLIAAHRAKNKRFSWAGLFGFLVLAVLVGALTYLFVEGV